MGPFYTLISSPDVIECIVGIVCWTSSQPADLEYELTKRQISPAVAEELVASASTEAVRTAIELFDWYNSRGQARGPGFLVNANRNPQALRTPKDFESSAAREEYKKAEISRNRAERDFSRRQEAKGPLPKNSESGRFANSGRSLPTTNESNSSRKRSVRLADSTKRAGYFRAVGKDDRVFEQYRLLIVRDHFDRTSEHKVAK